MKSMRFYITLLLTGFFLCSSCTGPEKGVPDRPNILLILSDDQSPFTLKVYGNKVCQTPNLDRLAAEGIVLDAAYHMGSWSGAVCLPSRTMIQTSLNVWRTKDLNKNYKRIDPETYMHEPDKWLSELSADDPASYSMPALFNRAAYSTYRTCKIGNSYEGANRLYTGRNDASKRGETDETGSWWHGEQVMNFLRMRENIEKKDPFLIFFGFSHPHDPRNGTSELLNKYGASNTDIPSVPNPKAPPLQANYLPAHPFPHGHPGLRDEERVQGVMLNRDEATIRNELGREYACIENIDRQIGTVLNKLEEMGDLAGIDAPETMDGISFKPVLLGEEEEIREVMYGAYCGGTKPGMRSVKKGDWKLIKYDVLEGEVRETQLFNLDENPDEFLIQHRDPAVVALTGVKPESHQVNLADDPEYAEKLREMEALLLEEMEKWEDPYRLWNQAKR